MNSMNCELKHSRFFIDKSFKLLKLSECKTKILYNNNILLGLLNVPTNPKLYKIRLVESSSNISNIQIIINVDYFQLKEYVTNNISIPNKKELFLSIKRNYLETCYKNNDNDTDNKSKYYYKKIVLKPVYYYKKDFIKINELVFDIYKEEIYLENQIDKSIYRENKIFNIINSYPNINIFKQILKIETKSILILHSKHNKLLLHTYYSKIKNKKKINILIIEDIFKNDLSRIFVETLILFDIENSSKLVRMIKDNINFKNLIIVNQKYINTPNIEYLEYIDNKCIDNIKTFNRSIINIKNTNIVFSKKIFKSYKNKNTKKFISILPTKQKQLYYSLEENIVNFNNINLKSNSLVNYKYNNCSICLDKIKLKSLVSTNCNHIYCESCLFKNLVVSNKCPQCRSHINTKLLFKNNSKYSNKINYIKSHIIHNKKLLIISNYKESINTLRNIFTNSYYIRTSMSTSKPINLFLLDVRNIVTITNYDIFDKILFLEDNYEDFNYYKYLFTDSNSKKKIEILT